MSNIKWIKCIIKVKIMKIFHIGGKNFKIKIKKILISISIKENERGKLEKKELMQKLDHLIGRLNEKEKLTNENFIDTKMRLKEIEDKELKGTQIRSRIKEITENEKPTKYFYNKEKRNAIINNIRRLKDQSEDIVETKEEIMKIVTDYYFNLWGKFLKLKTKRKINLQI